MMLREWICLCKVLALAPKDFFAGETHAEEPVMDCKGKGEQHGAA